MKTKRIFIIAFIAIASMPLAHSMQSSLATNQKEQYRLLLDQDTMRWHRASLTGVNMQDLWKSQENYLNGFENRVNEFSEKYPNFKAIKVIQDSINDRRDKIENQKMALEHYNVAYPSLDSNPSVSEFLKWYRTEYLKKYASTKPGPESQDESALDE